MSFSKTKNLLKSNKKIIESFSYLSVLQIFNLALPFITYPYLIRVLTANVYGSIVFAQTLIGYFVILVGFGFNISATKNISLYREDKKKVSEVVSSVFIIKSFLFLFSLIILWCLLYCVNGFDLSWELFFFSTYLCLNDLLFPIWYFQGIESMQFVTVFSVISKMVFLGAVFFIIDSPTDFLKVPILNGIGVIISGFGALYIVFIRHNVKFKWQRRATLFFYLKESWILFLSNAMVVIKERSNLIFIGYFLNMKDVAYYDLALKISSLLRTPFLTIRDAIFPNIAVSGNQSKYFRIGFVATLLAFFVYILLLVFREPIISILGGEKMLPTLKIFGIMSLTIPLGVASMFLGSALILFVTPRKYTSSVIYSVLLYLLGLYVIYINHLFELYYLVILLVLSLVVEIVFRTIYYINNERKKGSI